MSHIPTTPLAFVRFVSRPYVKYAILASLAVVAASSLGSANAYILRKIIDITTTQGVATSGALLWIILYPTAVLVGSLCWRLSGVLGAHWVIKSEADGYKALFEYMSHHSQTFFDNRFAGSLVGAIGTAAGGSSNMIEMFLWQYLDMFISLTVGFILVFSASPTVAYIFAGWIIALIPINYYLAKHKNALTEEETQAENDLRGKALDSANNMSVVHQFSRRMFEINRLDESITAHRIIAQRSRFFSEGILAANNILLSLFVASTIIPTFFFWRSGSVSLGELIMVITLVSMLLGSFTFIGNGMNYFAKNFGRVRKGLEDIMHPHDIVNTDGARDLVVDEGKIAFENVSFFYNENKAVLEKLDLLIKPGERVGIVGPSGAGKTTLIRLLLRQHEVTSGAVCIDNQDINLVTLESLRNAIGIVPQEPLLFHRTIKENIMYGKLDATDEEIAEAARLAQASSFIESFPDQYETLVGERGVKLSAGQRQRIAIARAILKNAPILILDEATSALDSESEVAIQKALETLMQGKTVLAIAHRLSTLREMDRIVVLEDGAITEEGSHEKLLKKAGGTYAKLWKHQAGGFLLEEEAPVV
jgi:ATP-binding cassette subfamily B protein